MRGHGYQIDPINGFTCKEFKAKYEVNSGGRLGFAC